MQKKQPLWRKRREVLVIVLQDYLGFQSASVHRVEAGARTDRPMSSVFSSWGGGATMWSRSGTPGAYLDGIDDAHHIVGCRLTTRVKWTFSNSKIPYSIVFCHFEVWYRTYVGGEVVAAGL